MTLLHISDFHENRCREAPTSLMR